MNNKPKVLYIMHMPPPYFGASMVGQRIKSSKTFQDSFDGTYINLSLANSIEDMGGRPMSKVVKYIKKIKQIRKTINSKSFDLCYLTPSAAGIPFLKDYLIVNMIKRKHIPVIIHYHNKGISKFQKKWFYNILYKNFFKNIKVILLSPLLYKDIEHYVSKENVYYSYVGIPEITNDIRTSKSKIILFSFISILLESKGVIDLIDACKILKAKGYNFLCKIAGRPSKEINEQKLNELIVDRGLTECVKYIGTVSEDSKNQLFAESHSFVFPTFFKSECFPAAILESMRSNTAVISTYEGAIPDEVYDGINGFLVKQHDINALAEKMECYIKDPSLAIKMGGEGRKLFEKKFKLSIFDETMITIFNKVLNNDY